jgi:hypothetical protein
MVVDRTMIVGLNYCLNPGVATAAVVHTAQRSNSEQHLCCFQAAMR